MTTRSTHDENGRAASWRDLLSYIRSSGVRVRVMALIVDDREDDVISEELFSVRVASF